MALHPTKAVIKDTLHHFFPSARKLAKLVFGL